METLEKEKIVHDALHSHIFNKCKHLNNHITKCSCGLTRYGYLTKEDFNLLIESNQGFHISKYIIHESEEWIWLGRAENNINSNFPHLFQKGRKLWTYCQGRFAPLRVWDGISRHRNSENSGRNSTIWKIAARRQVPLSIVLENTDDDNQSWVKKNWRKWVRESKEPINNAIGKKHRVLEARELLRKDRIKNIKFAKEHAEWQKYNN